MTKAMSPWEMEFLNCFLKNSFEIERSFGEGLEVPLHLSVLTRAFQFLCPLSQLVLGTVALIWMHRVWKEVSYIFKLRECVLDFELRYSYLISH